MTNKNPAKVLTMQQVAFAQKVRYTGCSDKELELKLLEIGCPKGTIVSKKKASIFGDPVLLKLFPNGNLLAVRKEELAWICIEELS